MLLVLPLTACGTEPSVITVAAPPVPALSEAEGEQFRCAPSPTLPAGAESYEDVLGLALRLRDGLDTCRDLNGRVIALATKSNGGHQ